LNLGSNAPPDRLVRLIEDHRRLDDLFGSFLAAATAGDRDAARSAIAEFDRELRQHTALEEEEIYPQAPDGKLAPVPEEGRRDRLAREMRLEHVQIRELSGMLDRLLGAGDLESARRLAGNLARRWDSHTTREEKDVFASAP
jgi:hypothetical protein